MNEEKEKKKKEKEKKEKEKEVVSEDNDESPFPGERLSSFIFSEEEPPHDESSSPPQEGQGEEDGESGQEGREEEEELSPEALGFKSSSELAKSYKELRSWVTRLSQEIAELKKAKGEPSLEEGQEKEEDVNLTEMLLEEPEKAIKELLKRMPEFQMLRVQNLYLQTRSKYPDFDDVAPLIEDVVSSLPPKLQKEIREAPEDYIDFLYEAAKARSVLGKGTKPIDKRSLPGVDEGKGKVRGGGGDRASSGEDIPRLSVRLSDLF